MSVKRSINVLFESLRGSWQLKRSLNSTLPNFPTGIFEGTATFTARNPRAHSTATELLYFEQGELKLETGLLLKAKRKYIYRYNADEDRISAWFVREDPGSKQRDAVEEVDYLFHELDFSASEAGWTAQGDHLCVKDMYWAFYDFRPPGIENQEGRMDVFGIRYKVKGPEKDYTSDTVYQRIPDTLVDGL